MKKHESFLHKIHLAFDNLAVDKRIQNKVICFVALPRKLFWSGLAQGVWMRGVNVDLPIYCDRQNMAIISDDLYENYVKFYSVKNGFRSVSENPDKLWFGGVPSDGFQMGPVIVNKKIYDGDVGIKRTDVSFLLDEKYLKQDFIFVTWDYEKFKFMVLDLKIKK